MPYNHVGTRGVWVVRLCKVKRPSIPPVCKKRVHRLKGPCHLRYFRRTRIIRPILLVVFGIMVAISEELRGYGLLTIVAGILWFIAVINMTPTDVEIDSVTKEFKKSIQEDAIRKLKDSYYERGVKKPTIIGGYQFKPFGDMRLLFKRGRDGKKRSFLYTESLFLFTDNPFVHRRLVFSIVQPAVTTSTEEYYYDDIVTIKSHETDSKPFPNAVITAVTR